MYGVTFFYIMVKCSGNRSVLVVGSGSVLIFVSYYAKVFLELLTDSTRYIIIGKSLVLFFIVFKLQSHSRK